ncbi:MAG: OmpH family outer membrane protein [Crocinitomicaceae bacterium]|nr:OmpH family outer membrane protein [Crocinitomicaceae bacterium]
MKKSIYSVLIVMIATLIVSCNGDGNSQRIVFMENAKVFEKFEMKKDYDKLIERDLSNEVKQLDSLGLEINKQITLGDSLSVFKLKKQYYIIEQQYNKTFESISSKYTNEVNDRLNEYLKLFSEEKGYDLILGSSGQGNVMYIKEGVDISDELIKFINHKYSN